MQKCNVWVSKLVQVSEFLCVVATYDKRDIFSKPQDSEEWKTVNLRVEERWIDEPERLRETKRKFLNSIFLGNACVSKCQGLEGKWWK